MSSKANYFNCSKCGGPGADKKGGLCSDCKTKKQGGPPPLTIDSNGKTRRVK